MLKRVCKIACQIDKVFSDDKKELDLYIIISMYDKSGYFLGSFESWLRDLTLYDGGYILFKMSNKLFDEEFDTNEKGSKIEFTLINKSYIEINEIKKYIKSILLDFVIQENISITNEICK